MFQERFYPRVAIAVGFSMELSPLRQLIDGTLHTPVKNGASVKFYHGKIDEADVILFVSGMGMNKARTSTSEVLQRYPSIKYVIDTGTAGSISAANPPDIVIPDQWEDYSRVIGQGILDKLLCGSGYNQQFSKAVGINNYLLELAKSVTPEVGTVILGGVGLCSSKILIREKHKLLLQERYPQADIVDMESYAVVQACQQRDNPVSVIAIRAVSDIAGRGYRAFLGNFSGANKANLEVVKQNYTMFVGALIKKLA